MELPYKKRHRVPASCSVCRKRKLKCDRVKPICGSCKLKSIAHLCFYESESKDGSTVYTQNQYNLVIPPEGNHGIGQNDGTIQTLPPENQIPQNINHNQPQKNIPPPPLVQSVQAVPPPPQLSTPINGNIPLPLPNPAFVSPIMTTSNKPIPYSRENSFFAFPNNPTPKLDQESPQLLSNSQYPSPENFISPGASSITSNQSYITHPTNNHSRHPSRIDEEELVTIPLSGPTTLKVNPRDTLHVFTNASYSLNLEGPLWQQQGTFSYIGLTKSDPFIKIIRNFTVLLFKSGEMANFIKAKPLKRKRQTPSSESSIISDYNIKRKKVDTAGSPELNEPDENENEPEEEDALIVTKINKGRSQEEDDEEVEQEKLEEKANLTLNNGENIKNTPIGAKPIDSSKHRTSIDIPQILPGLSLLFNGKKSRKDYYAIVERAILAILPDKLNLFMLFCRYFKYVHPFVPIIDEHSMLTDLESIFDSFPSFSRGKYTEVIIDNDNSLIILGNFLLIIRLGYSSLIHNDNVTYNEDEQSMVNEMARITPENFTKILNLCIGDCFVQSKSSLKIVQVLTLLHFYRMVDPNDCHGLGGADAQILFGVIVKHAMSIGLNRDPTFYTSHQSIYKNKDLIRIWRAMWHYLVYMDASSSIHCGSCLDIGSLDMCDVEFPVYDDKSGHLNEMVKSIGSICHSYRKIVQKINNVHNKPKVVDVLKETNKLEKIFYSLFGKDYFKEHICKPAPVNVAEVKSMEHETSYLKVLKFGIFLSLRTNLSCMYYMIAIHYENDKTMKKSISNPGLELFKIYIKSVVQLVYIMSYVLENSIELFGRNYDYVLTALNERCMIKTHSFLTSFFVRLLHHKRYLSIQLETDPSVKPRLQVTDRLYELVLRESELFVGNFRRLSRKYVNSYKLYVMIYFVLKQCMTNPNVFFAKTMNHPEVNQYGTNSLQYFTISELEYLCKLCEEFKVAKSGQVRTSTALMDDEEFLQHFRKFDYARSQFKVNQDNNGSQNVDFKNDPPDIDLSEFTANKMRNANFTDITPFGVNDIEANNLDSNFNYGMLENPNVDLVQLFELFVDMEEKDPTM